MSKFASRRSKKSGLPPGTLVHIGSIRPGGIKVSLIDYSKDKLAEREVKDLNECFKLKTSPSISWINIDGLHETEKIAEIGKGFGLHPLLLEDILNTEQRPKMEDYEDYLFIVMKMLFYDEKTNSIRSEQISLVIGKNYLITFQESEGDIFDGIRARLRNNKGRLRSMGSDFLAYSIIDAIVDNYFMILEKVGEEIEDLEDKIIANPTPRTIQEIHGLKREMIFLRKSVWPLREVVSGMQRTGSKLIKKSTGVYLRDVYDHTIQVIDTVETYRDILSGMLDIYLSSISNRMNEIMKVLTIIGTIFIPLTFLTGIYGMNFHYMPELENPYAYYGIWISFIIITAIMILYFKRKKWM